MQGEIITQDQKRSVGSVVVASVIIPILNGKVDGKQKLPLFFKAKTKLSVGSMGFV